MQESFPDEEALQQAVVRGPGPAEDFARYFLALRENRATRIPFAQFCDDVRNKGKDQNGRQRHYWRALVGRLWDHYISAARELSHHTPSQILTGCFGSFHPSCHLYRLR